MTRKMIREFRRLFDVNFGTPNDGDVPTYDQATDKLIMAAPTGGGGGPPSGPAGGVLSGTYPDPGFAVDMATQAELDAHATDTSSVHGIADTTVLATDAEVIAAVLASEAGQVRDGDAAGGVLGGTYPDPGFAVDMATQAELDANAAASVNDGDAAGGVLGGTYPNPSFATDMATQAELDAHVSDASDAHAGSAITNTPAGGIAATTVQGAIDELDSEKTTAAAALSAAQTEIADQKRVVEILVSDPNGSAITTGDGKAYVRIPSLLNGHNLVSCAASLTTVSSSGTPTVQLRRLRLTNATTQAAADMLSTGITIDASEFDSKDATTAAVIDTSNDDVQTGDQIAVDIDVAGTGAKGLIVTMTFEAP